jgi:hypothetical protein
MAGEWITGPLVIVQGTLLLTNVGTSFLDECERKIAS